MSSRAEQLRQENAQLKQRIAQIQSHQRSNDLEAEISRFVDESKKNLSEMNRKIAEENQRQNALLHTMTANYEAVLKKQIELLN